MMPPLVLRPLYRRYLWDLGHARSVAPQRMGEIVDNGPYMASEALQAGLVDETIEADELEDSLEEVYGKRARLDDEYMESLERRRSWPGGPSVAVIHVQGNLTDGEGFDTVLASNAVEVHVSSLRRKLGRELLQTVRGMGYRIGGGAA